MLSTKCTCTSLKTKIKKTQQISIKYGNFLISWNQFIRKLEEHNKLPDIWQ